MVLKYRNTIYSDIKKILQKTIYFTFWKEPHSYIFGFRRLRRQNIYEWGLSQNCCRSVFFCIFRISDIYSTRLLGNLLESFPIDSYDKNACKRAQDRCQTRSGAGEPLFLSRDLAGPPIYTADTIVLIFNRDLYSKFRQIPMISSIFAVFWGAPATKVMVLRHQNEFDNVLGRICMGFCHRNRQGMFPGGFQAV